MIRVHVIPGVALALAIGLVGGCEPDASVGPESGWLGVDLTDTPYEPVAYAFDLPGHFPEIRQPGHNPATVEGVALGRHLFFDPLLSRDSTVSCASCHRPELAFTDGRALAEGIDGRVGRRSSMSLVNVGLQSSFFWDGRSGSLEEQSLHPVEDPLEMDHDWASVERDLRGHPDYPARFRRAFGIERAGEIDRELVAKALAQFERSITSGTSEFDRVVYGVEGFLSDLEEEGRFLFFAEPSTEHPGCAHCHNAPAFADVDLTGGFRNNGLDSATEVTDFVDLGRGVVTGNPFDNGKFRAPTLRNVELTAPYMHDGRFATLDEVLDHYASGGHYSPTLDPQILPFRLDDRRRAALKAFLLTLTDPRALERAAVNAPTP